MSSTHARLILVPWLWNKMAFIKRKTVKFSVDLQVCHLSDVPLVNAVVFAKLRLLEGGSFEDSTERVEVKNHGAGFATRFDFCCRIPCDQASGTLEKCLCRVSIRKEQRGGRSFYKLGYVDINLSEFAATGIEGISQTYLLNGYTSNQRLDNSKVCVKVAMSHQSADPFFRVPQLSTFGPNDDRSLNPEAFKALDPVVKDSDEGQGQSHPKVSVLETQECASASGGSGVDDASNDRRGNHQGHQGCQHRRFSQDRSAQKIHHTRFDADNVIDKIMANCKISEDSVIADHHGLSLEKFLDKNGKPIVFRQPVKRSSYASDQYRDDIN